MNIKKVAKRGSLALISLAIIAAVALAFALVYKLNNFKKVTFETVLKTEHKHFSEHYGIGNSKDPADYGFPNFITHKFQSEDDGIELSGWYIPAKNKDTKKCILLVHGRRANRLRTLKYLKLFRQMGITLDHSVFIVDLRNSGQSEDASTAMGYEFAEDIYYSLLFTNKTYNHNDYIVYAFSMGAMGTSIMLNREELRDGLKDKGITINKLLFDSPVTNIEKLIYYMATDRNNMPSWIAQYGLFAYNIRLKNYMANMRLSELYKNIDIPLMILQAKKDETTLYDHLMSELEILNDKSVTVNIFETGGHVRIYQQKENENKYTHLVADYIKSK